MADKMSNNFQKRLTKQVGERFSQILFDKKMSQKDVQKLVREKHKIEINSGTISKMLNAEVLPPMYKIAMIADVLECPIGALLGDKVDVEPTKKEESAQQFLRSSFAADKNLLLDPSEKDFSRIMGKFHCYFWPTYSGVQTPHVGEIEFTKYEGICKVHFRLHTGRTIPESTEEYIKEYVGILAIAKPVKACFCLLKGNEDITSGELCFLAFRCLQLNKQVLESSIAEVVTISAGNAKKVPTAHRMLLSRKELNNEQLTNVMPSLYLNTSRFIIREKNLRDYADFTDAESKVINLIERTSPAESSWFFTEKEIRGYAERVNLTDAERNLLINKLRSISESEKYNKASDEANDIVWSIINTVSL